MACPSLTFNVQYIRALNIAAKATIPLCCIKTSWLLSANAPTLRSPRPHRAPPLFPHATLLRALAQMSICSMMLLSPSNLSTVLKMFLPTSTHAQGKGFATVDRTNLKSTVHVSCFGFETFLLPLHPLSLTRLPVSNDLSKAFLRCTISSLHWTFCAISKYPQPLIASTATIFSPQLLAYTFFNPYRL